MVVSNGGSGGEVVDLEYILKVGLIRFVVVGIRKRKEIRIILRFLV